jgi:hypothetical protein
VREETKWFGHWINQKSIPQVPYIELSRLGGKRSTVNDCLEVQYSFKSQDLYLDGSS